MEGSLRLTLVQSMEKLGFERTCSFIYQKETKNNKTVSINVNGNNMVGVTIIDNTNRVSFRSKYQSVINILSDLVYFN